MASTTRSSSPSSPSSPLLWACGDAESADESPDEHHDIDSAPPSMYPPSLCDLARWASSTPRSLFGADARWKASLIRLAPTSSTATRMQPPAAAATNQPRTACLPVAAVSAAAEGVAAAAIDRATATVLMVGPTSAATVDPEGRRGSPYGTIPTVPTANVVVVVEVGGGFV
jgi:hypothetical protein